MSKIGHNKPPSLDPKLTIIKNINRKKPILDRDPQFYNGIPLPSWIELSLIDTCNRSCSFCPKSDPKIAPNTHHKMENVLIEKLYSDLKKIKFEGAFCLCGYGEPLLHKEHISIINKLGEIGVTDSFKNIVDFFGGLSEKISSVLDGDGIGSKLAKGLVKGISAVVTGPGLLLVGVIIAKLAKDFVAFGIGSLKTFLGMNRAAKEQAQIQGQIASALLNDSNIRKSILDIENSSLSVEQKRKMQADALNDEQKAAELMKQFGLGDRHLTDEQRFNF